MLSIEKFLISKKYIIIVGFMLAIITCLSRGVYLDNDLPYKVLHSYAAFDEFYYTIPGFNLYHYGVVNPEVIPGVIEEKNSPTNISQNLMTCWMLKAFGNNFWGLRMGSVLASVLIVILFFLTLQRLIFINKLETSRKACFALLFVMIYLITDFTFLNASRVAEPTIYRILALVVLLYVGSFLNESYKKSWFVVLLGFLSCGAVCFVYIYNAFIYAAFGTTIFFLSFRKGSKEVLRSIGLFLLGTLICILVYQAYIHYAYNYNLTEVYRNLVPFHSRIAVDTSSGSRIDSFLKNIVLIIMTNIFRFNLLLLFGFLISIPVMVNKLQKELNKFDILIISLVGFLILQSIFINDYALRKLLIMLPLVLVLIFNAYLYFPTFISMLRSDPHKLKLVRIYWVLFSVATMLVFLLYLKTDLSGDWLLVSTQFTIINLTVWSLGTVLLIVHYLYDVKMGRPLWSLLAVAVLIPNIFLTMNYVFMHRTTYYRDTMIEMADTINGKVIVGGVGYAFRLYNTSIPVLNFYATAYGATETSADSYHSNFDRLFADGIANYSIAIIKDIPDDNVVNSEYMTQHNLVLEHRYNLKDIFDADIGLFGPIFAGS